MKYKILDNLPTIWIALMFTLGLALASTNAKAGPEGMSQYPWTPMSVPMWCGPIEEVNTVLEKEVTCWLWGIFSRRSIELSNSVFGWKYKDTFYTYCRGGY